ncbi:MAG: hypothetical protein HY716_17730 [Planctomycetes bacterium]|nr:hypothetical protein [Planctomycetota bacterium]
MGWYDGRISELNDLFTRASEGISDSARRALTECIAKVGSVSDAALSALVDFSERASAGNLGTARKWEDRCAAVKADVSRLFGDAAKDQMLPPALQLFWYQAIEHEMKFWETLGKVRTPQLHDDLLVHQDVLNKMLGELWDKWTFLLSKDASFETDETQAVREVAQIAAKIVEDLDSKLKAFREKYARANSVVLGKLRELNENTAGAAIEVLKKLIEKIFGIEIPDGIDVDVLLATIQDHYQYLSNQIALFRTKVAVYRSLVQAEQGSVLLLFNGTRADVNRYLETNDIGKARVWLDQAKGFLSDWASARPTTAQKNAATAFRDKIASLIDEDWKRTEELDGKFREKFKGVFIAPLGNETIEQLAERYLFQKHLEDAKRPGASSKASSAASEWPALVSGSLDQTFRAADDAVARVPDAVRDLARMKNDEFKRHVERRLKEGIDRLLPIILEISRIFDPSNLDREFSREELERLLR